MEKVSIIIPTYKRASLINKTIDSVLNQTYRNIEIIIVDDNILGSNQEVETKKALEKYLNLPNFFYIKNKDNLGGALSRNVGIEKATGTFVSFLDDDDQYLPKKTEVQVSEMLKNNWDFSVMDGSRYNSNDQFIDMKKQFFKNDMPHNELQKIHLIHQITGTNTFMVKRSIVNQVNGFANVAACQEYFLVQKLLDIHCKIGYIEEDLVKNYIYSNERLSFSLGKINALNVLINKKKEYFSYLNKKEKRMVMCRHNAVLFLVNFKLGKYFPAFINAGKSFVNSPRYLFLLLKESIGVTKI